MFPPAPFPRTARARAWPWPVLLPPFTPSSPRSDTAMTGEITLSGLVLPIGGVKEKVLAARAAGLRRVILPRANEKDLVDLPPQVREEMEFIFATQIGEVLAAAIPSLEAAMTALS